MKLTIHTDLINDSWLSYILEEFKRICGAQFEIQITKGPEIKKQINTIYYTQNPKSGLTQLQRKDHIAPNNNFEWLRKDFYVLKGSTNDNHKNLLSYDVLWNSFIHISRIEEWYAEKKGNLVHSYSLKHPRKDKETFDIPIVNYYFEDLKKAISNNFPEMHFTSPKMAEIEWSHDLDYITKTFQLRLKQTAFNGFNTIKSIGSGSFGRTGLKTINFLFSNPSYWCFDFWINLEKKYKVNSVFYIYAKHQIQKQGGQRLKSWIINPSYDVTNNIDLQNKLKSMKDNGFKIGLHGSYNSATDIKLLEIEKDTLERALGIEATKTRQHWLNYNEKQTPKLHEKLFKEDSSISWNDRPGFRAGICSPFFPYNHAEKKSFKFIIIPQILMDSHIFDYNYNTEKALNLVQLALNVPSSKFSVSWHPRTCTNDYKWHLVYEKILKSYYNFKMDKSKLE